MEAQLRSELAEVERRIAKLVEERRSLQRLLISVRNKNLGGSKDARRNSYERLVVETKILESLRQAGKRGVLTKKLREEAFAINPLLKDPTYRSYLHRLKERGLIAPVTGRRGRWSLCDHVQSDRSKDNRAGPTPT
jgi:hypothetical protein